MMYFLVQFSWICVFTDNIHFQRMFDTEVSDTSIIWDSILEILYYAFKNNILY